MTMNHYTWGTISNYLSIDVAMPYKNMLKNIAYPKYSKFHLVISLLSANNYLN